MKYNGLNKIMECNYWPFVHCTSIALHMKGYQLSINEWPFTMQQDKTVQRLSDNVQKYTAGQNSSTLK
jgi:hypothetical protein